MLKLSISARFFAGMKLSWKANAEEEEQGKTRKQVERGKMENVLVRKRWKQRERQNKRVGLGGKETGE